MSVTDPAPQIPDPAVVPDVGGERATPRRAGRNLPAAIAVGLALGAVILVPLYTRRVYFGVGVVGAAVAVGIWELARALRDTSARVTVVPLAVGGGVMVVATWQRGAEGLVFALVATILCCFAWRIGDGSLGYLRDVTASVIVAMYVPMLACFAVLLTRPADGARRIVALIATVVCSDVGGYAAGVLTGRHPMAPTVSPKKSWEGFAGSASACVLFGALVVARLLDLPVWQGLAYGLAVVATATFGDLAESMIKRDIGIKDMGHLLPGHGGLLDRLDSILITAPVAWLLLSAWAGSGGAR